MLINPHYLLPYLLVVLTINFFPGPDMMLVISRSLGAGKRASLITVLGISAGSIIHTMAAALGISAILFKSALAFQIIKYIGVTYLIYLGLKMLFAKSKFDLSAVEKENANLRQSFWQGFLSNILNPKVALFYLAFLPQFVTVDYGYVPTQMLLLGFIFIISGTLVNAGVALGFYRLQAWFALRPLFFKLQQKISGVILLALGLRLMFLQREN